MEYIQPAFTQVTSPVSDDNFVSLPIMAEIIKPSW